MAGPVRENHREDVAGRANVEDTPELLAYYNELEQLDTAARWTVAGKIEEPWQPKSVVGAGVVAAYRDLRAHVLPLSRALVNPEKAGRRVIYLGNPGRRDGGGRAVGLAPVRGLEVGHPGRSPAARAHSASALRFIVERRGAYTIVDGHKMTLGTRRLRPDAEQDLARARRGVRGNLALHLAGRAGYSAGKHARSQLLRRAPRHAAGGRLSGRRRYPVSRAIPALRPATR